MKNKKKIILGSIIGIIIGLLISTTYAIFSYNKLGNNNQVVAGDIYMHYNESNTLTLNNAMPSSTYDPNNYFEFTIKGKNTNKKYNIVYDINLNYGDEIENKIRIQDRFLKFRLVEVENNEETELLNDKSYLSIDNKRIYVSTINKNQTTEITKTYRLYVWIDNSVVIGNTDYSDYSINDWNNVYGSIKVSVTGDFSEKEIQTEPYLVMKNLNEITDWTTIRSNVTSIEFHTDEIIPNDAITSFDVTDETSSGDVTLYTIDDGLGNNTYKAVIVGDDIIYAPESCSRMFYNCINLIEFNSKNFNVDNVTTMPFMFWNCNNLKEIESFETWKTSKVTNMQNMFMNCTNLVNVSALKNWNVEKVETMQYMFYNCIDLADIRGLSNWTTTQLNNLNFTFSACTSLKSLDGLENWNIANITGNLQSTFNGCSALTDISALSNWDTRNVLYFVSLFKDCSNLNNIDALVNWNVRKVLYMNGMFQECYNLTDVNALSNWDVSNVTNMQNMFFGCINLTDISGLSNWNVSDVTNMSYIFASCYNLTDVNPLANWATKTGKVETMQFMFGMGSGKSKTGDPIIDFSPLSNWNVSSVTNMQSMFQNVNILSYQAFRIWNVSKVKNFHAMFNQTSASIVTTLAGLENWNVESATNMTAMFQDNVSLADASAINNWDINASIDFTGMFGNTSVHPVFTKVVGTWDSNGTFTPSN